jgi:hypothetical protein
MRHIAAVVLETDGSFSVIPAGCRDVPERASALKDTDLFGRDSLFAPISGRDSTHPRRLSDRVCPARRSASLQAIGVAVLVADIDSAQGFF